MGGGWGLVFFFLRFVFGIVDWDDGEVVVDLKC